MKKVIVILIVVTTCFLQAQNIQVQNMINYLRHKEYVKAKQSADAAAIHESTKGSAKMWMLRGDVYRAIYDTSARDLIDAEAEEKAVEAYINCLKLDKEKNIYKDDVKGNIVRAAAATNRKTFYYRDKKEWGKALHCYDLLEEALVFDFDQGMKRQNITKEKILYNKFEMYKQIPNKEKTIELASKLIEIRYKEPKIYTDMTKISLRDRDTAAALAYIEKGKVLFDDNMELLATEIDIYLVRKKVNELKDKLKAAIELAPDNEILHVVLGQVYLKTNDLESAEKEYTKAYEIKPESEVINYSLGAFYFNMGNEYNKKLNDLAPSEKVKTKEYEEKVKENFKKAVPLLEKAYEITPDKAYKQRLLQAYLRLGETEKAAKYK